MNIIVCIKQVPETGNVAIDEETGTMAAVIHFKNAGGPKVISVDGSKSIGEVTELIMKEF